jgi:SAM-dependent methyltransferase
VTSAPSSTISAAYSATGAAWARGPERVYLRLAEALVGCSPVPLTGRVVADVGAGTGAAGRAAVLAGARSVVAVDAAVGMLRFEADVRPPAVAGDARSLPFASGSFDGAVAAFSLNHLRDPAAGLREMARIVRPSGPVLASAYAADDTHPVKPAVEGALVAAGWSPPDWYDELRREITPQLATRAGCEAALAAAAAGGACFAAGSSSVRELRVPFPELSADQLVAWRLGMAQHAPFVAGLSAAALAAVVDDALARLGPSPPTLVRSVLVIAAVTPVR